MARQSHDAEQLPGVLHGDILSWDKMARKRDVIAKLTRLVQKSLSSGAVNDPGKAWSGAECDGNGQNAEDSATSEATRYGPERHVERGAASGSNASGEGTPPRDSNSTSIERPVDDQSCPVTPASFLSVPDIQLPPVRVEDSQSDRSPQASVTSFYPELGANYDTRIITIKPEEDDWARIECSSEAVALHDDQVTFDALSYSWGENKLSHSIRLNGHEMRVRQTLYEALRALRARRITKIWIDALSINQDDNTDKDRQIGKMHVIYSHAIHVYAWIGSSADAKAANGVLFLGGEGSNSRGEEIVAVQSVVSMQYWKRSWIIQELCRARKAYILCGNASAEFVTFWRKLKDFQLETESAWVNEDMRVQFESFNVFQQQESAKTRGSQMPLIEALLLSRYSKATIPRDKIFAMLNLAHDSNKLVDTPNYSQTDNVVYLNLAHNMIHLQGHVGIILLARRDVNIRPSSPMESHKPKSADARLAPAPPTLERLSSLTATDLRDFRDRDLPSWAPYWPELDDPLPPWIHDSVLSHPKPRSGVGASATSHEGTTLRVYGVSLEVIDSISGMITNPTYVAPTNKSPPTPGNPRSDEESASSLSRRSTMKNKQFANHVEVIRKLWNAVLAPVCAERGQNIPDMHHDCHSFACRWGDEGFAVALVLTSKDTTSHSDIHRWMQHNGSFQIGSRTLNQWLEEFVAKSAQRNDGGIVEYDPRAAARKRSSSLCNTAREADWLNRGFQLMERYKMRLAVTSRCSLRLVYREARPEDSICRLDGCSLPVVLRNMPRPLTPTVHPEEGGSVPQAAPAPFSDFDQPSSPLVEDSPNEALLPPAAAATATRRQGSLPPHMIDEVQLSRENSMSTLTPSHPVGDESCEFTYVGEVYLHNHLHSPWADQTKFGWKDSLFLKGRWRWFRIV